MSRGDGDWTHQKITILTVSHLTQFWILLGQIPEQTQTSLKLMHSDFSVSYSTEGNRIHSKTSCLSKWSVQVSFWHPNLSLLGWCNSNFVPLANFINTVNKYFFSKMSLTNYIKLLVSFSLDSSLSFCNKLY